MNMRPFELALMVTFFFLALGAVVFLAIYKPESKETPGALGVQGTVEIWGVLPSGPITNLFNSLTETKPDYARVVYRQVRPEVFNQTFLAALADDQAPDLVLLRHDQIVPHRGRLQAIPYQSFPLVDFRNRYLDGAGIFALNSGVVAVPVGVDPLVMYWNRDLFATENRLTPPSTWEEIVADTVPTLVRQDFSGQISRPVLAMGEFTGVENAEAVLLALTLQGGSEMVSESTTGYTVALDRRLSVGQLSGGDSTRPFRNAVSFFMSFSNRTNALYTWNRSLGSDRTQFTADNLALYFGFLSEARSLNSTNPNLNFGLAPLPQSANANVQRHYGEWYGLAMVSRGKNSRSASIILTDMMASGVLPAIALGSGLVPAERAVVAQGSNDFYGRIGYQVAPTTYAWLSPGRAETDLILSDLVEGLKAGRGTVDSLVADTITRLANTY